MLTYQDIDRARLRLMESRVRPYPRIVAGKDALRAFLAINGWEAPVDGPLPTQVLGMEVTLSEYPMEFAIL